MSTEKTIGFIGLGRLGLPFAANLAAAGYDVASCARGRSDELVRAGGRVAGDGSARAVALQARVLITCVQDDAHLEAAVTELLSAEGELPVIIEMSTVSIPLMQRLRDRLRERGGELLDCPVSGTPDMAAAKKAVVFASGDKDAYEGVKDVIAQIAPANVFVGELGAGTNFKYVANLLAFVNVTAAIEAMAFAAAAGLDLNLVAGVISQSPGATSGQFNIRAPMIAEGKFDSRLVTVDQMREVCEQIVAHGDQIGASTPLIGVVRDLYDEFAAQGENDSDPAKLFLYLQERARSNA
ncbi:MAG TPA: NAD(P)-dependent oxidoreductase [Solirubrobacteraceae bacterium]|jgi:3-hydroxyisobutyrate dehydrogenase-like beta-hydroxyacid dehydrogenase|nr:NAD(P)-dependent oxidoreductase [Solirubrobacteraceae bacterium]